MATVLEEVSKEGFREYSSDFQVRPFRVVVLTDWSVTGQGVFSHCCWFWPLSTWFCCFSGPGAETQLRPRCYLQGGKVLPWRQSKALVFPFFQFSQFCTGDHLQLAVMAQAVRAAVCLGFPVPLAKEHP